MWFYVTTAATAAIIAFVLLITMIRGRSGDAPAAAYDLKVYRDQLKEVEKDLARGVISGEEAARVRLEVSRRILEADRAAQAEGAGARAPKAATWAVGGVLAAAVVGGSLLLYDQVGAPGYPDVPLKARVAAADELRQTRPRQAEAEEQMPQAPGPEQPDPRHLELVEKLRAVVAQRPDDIQGLKLLAGNEAALGNFRNAYIAQSRMIALKGDAATAEDFAALTDLMVLAAGGYVSPEAEAAIEQTLNRDQANGTARYYLGLLYVQTGRPDITFRIWRGLLNDSAPDDPWVTPIRAGIEELAFRAGEDYTLPPLATGPALRGPSAEDMANAADMTPQERMEMIRGMVENLNDRLANEGGTAAEWAQLIAALGNLGETDRAAAIWGEAQQVFAARPDDLGTIRAAAERAGVAE
ncbi:MULTISPECIES: c-type cytochrome biogenesis protein CcmI [Actibacterium]|uniref:Cytochrome c-type biogenesis protein CcmH n=1 Tax=Actibacterium naphthalenivorans TaxID=1614693 RepID=A0A840C7G1_9RHOB|nr:MULTISPECIES: c-type cytochrome biogenesis protein CcmI [Actibacterium]ALG90038.1 cytochrome C [Actibacterium sp. EMB200-NS6]MBB4021884.1 cytochrome c-type biogenesis protein CcmH [Actibacterium naphthalenivorans]